MFDITHQLRFFSTDIDETKEISLYLDIDVDLIDMAILSTEEVQSIEEVNDCTKCRQKQ